VVLVLHAPHPEAGGLLLSKLGKHCKSAGARVTSNEVSRAKFDVDSKRAKNHSATVLLTGDGFNYQAVAAHSFKMLPSGLMNITAHRASLPLRSLRVGALAASQWCPRVLARYSVCALC
jgi:hypothetical protein